MQSKRIKKLIIANVVLLGLLVAGFTYAWFATSYGNVVDADQVQVIADSALELSFDNSNWSTYLKLDTTGLEFTDITGSGDSKGDENANGAFWKPSLSQMGGYAEVTSGEADVWKTPVANKDYIKFDLYMRSAEKYDVYLGKGASVTPVSRQLIGLAENDSTNNKSAFGKFSKDLVAGAVRVSAVADANSSTHSHLFTWIPCPNIYLPFGPSEEITEYSGLRTDFAKNETVTGNIIHPFKHFYYPTKKAAEMTELPADKLVTNTITETTQKKLASLTKASDSDTYYTGKVTVYIWLEGCDNEARRAFVDGKFTVKLLISAQDSQA